MKKTKTDNRAIPRLFRAVERSEHPKIFYGSLMSDDGVNVVCFACHDGEESHVMERVLLKSKFNFSEISVEEFSIQARPALHVMKQNTLKFRFELDAAVDNERYAERKIVEIVGPR